MVGLIKKYWVFMVLAALATLLGFVWFKKSLASPVQKQPQVKEQSLSKIEGFSILGVNVNPQTQFSFSVSSQPEEKAPLLSVVKNPPYTKEEMTEIAKTLGFTTEPVESGGDIEGKTLSWNQNPNFLSVNEGNNIDYGRDLILSPLPQKGQFLAKEDALAKIRGLLQKLGINGGLSSPQERFLLLDAPIPVETKIENASIQEITSGQLVGGREIIDFKGEGFFVKAWFDKTGEIAKLQIRDIVSSASLGQEYPLKTLPEIKQAVQKTGKVFFVEGASGPPDSDQLGSILISSIELEYFLATDGKTAHPVFLLKGIKQEAGESRKLSIFLPAIKDIYYK